MRRAFSRPELYCAGKEYSRDRRNGTQISAAVKYAQEQDQPKNIVTFVCDSGNKYLTKMYNDFWMIDQGFIQQEKKNNLEDLVTRKYSEHSIISVKSDDTLLNAHSKMRMYEISQLPVIDGNEVIGIIDEWDILTAVENGDENILNNPIHEYMSQDVVSVSIEDDLSRVVSILKKVFGDCKKRRPLFRTDYQNGLYDYLR